jgi:hypothetical protein
MSGKIRVSRTFAEFRLEDGIDHLVEVFSKAKAASLQDENSNESWINLRVCYDIYDNRIDLSYIEGDRWETDEEHDFRIKQDKKNKEMARKRNKTLKAEKEKYEREMYEQLKKKYGDK